MREPSLPDVKIRCKSIGRSGTTSGRRPRSRTRASPTFSTKRSATTSPVAASARTSCGTSRPRCASTTTWGAGLPADRLPAMDQSAESGPAQRDPSGLAPPTAESQPRYPRLAAWAPWMIAALCIGLVAVGVAWAREPLARREILFETPVRIVPGLSVTGAFTPEGDVPCAIELRFREVWPEPLSEPQRGGRVAAEALGKDVGEGGWASRRRRALRPGTQ